MAFQTQYNVTELIGTLANRPSPTTLRAAGTIYHTTDGNGSFVLIAFANPASNIWDPIAGSSGGTGTLEWPKYVVATPLGPTSVFTSIQTAINTAVSDGHGPTGPAVVLVHPGTYTETVTLSDGIHLAGLSDNDDAGVVLAGDVSTTGGTNNISGMTVSGSVSVSGSADVALSLRKVHVAPVSGTALNVSNNGESSFLSVVDSIIEANDGGAVSLASSGSTEIDSDRSSFLNLIGSSAVVAPSTGPLNFSRCTFRGQIQLTGPAAAVFEDCDYTVDSQPVMSTVDGGSQVMFGGRIQQIGSPAPTIGGTSSSFQYDHVTGFVPTNFFNVATSVATSALAEARSHTRQAFNGAGPHVPDIAITDLSVISPPSGGTATFVMPRTRNLPDGVRVSVRQLSTNGTTTITPTGGSGDTVNGGGSVNFATGVHGAEFQNDPTDQNWVLTVLF